MGFIYIAPPPGQLSPKLQGDRIETPEYIRTNKLQPDYKYYIEHQLEKPIGQLFGLVVDQIPGYKAKSRALADGEQDVVASELLFRKALQECDKLSRHAFVQRFGIAVQPSESAAGTERRSPRIAQAEQLIAPTKQTQTSINSYFLHKAFVEQYTETKAAAKVSLQKKDKEDKKKKK